MSRAIATAGYVLMVPLRLLVVLPLAVVLMAAWALTGWSTRERMAWRAGGIVQPLDRVNSITMWVGWRVIAGDGSVGILRVRAWPMSEKWRRELPLDHRMRIRPGDISAMRMRLQAHLAERRMLRGDS